jgi:hypothetical protein
MQIISIDDCDFPVLLSAYNNAKEIGSFTKNGHVQIVRASEKFMMITPDGETKKIAIKPVRNQQEANQLARQFLNRERERGSDVAFEDQEKQG